MRVVGVASVELLPRAGGGIGGEPAADGADRRAAHCLSLLWEPADHGVVGDPGRGGEPQAGAAAVALDGIGGDSSEAAAVGEGPGSQGLPVFAADVAIERVGQVWWADITYVPLPTGFMYLAATIDWWSRYVVSWRLSNTLDGSFCLEMLEEALRLGKPEVFNTDQGVQFTASAWTGRLESAGVAVSMDGRGRCLDNVFVERLWRTVKKDPTRTGARCTRCRNRYNRGDGRLPVGLARTGPLLRGVSYARRIRTMSKRTAAAPPRA